MTITTPLNSNRPREPGVMRRGPRSRGESGPGMNGKGGSNTPLIYFMRARNKTFHRELVPDVAITRTEETCMRRIALIGLALLAMTVSASARLGIAPMAAQDGGVIQVRGGHGHGHGHMGRGGRGHHY